MMKRILVAMLAATPAGAQQLAPPPVLVTPGAVIAPGNLPPDFYPKSPCIKPDLASIGSPPRNATDNKAVAEFNARVEAYNKVAPAFNACVRDYAARAQNDVARINAAIRDANLH